MAVQDRRPDERELAIKVYEFICKEILTEEHSDLVIEIVTSYVPFGLGWPVKKLLDLLLPNQARGILREILQALGFLRRSDRYLDEDNPFRRKE